MALARITDAVIARGVAAAHYETGPTLRRMLADNYRFAGFAVTATDIARALRAAGWHAQTSAGDMDLAAPDQRAYRAQAAAFYGILVDVAEPSTVKGHLLVRFGRAQATRVDWPAVRMNAWAARRVALDVGAKESGDRLVRGVLVVMIEHDPDLPLTEQAIGRYTAATQRALKVAKTRYDAHMKGGSRAVKPRPVGHGRRAAGSFSVGDRVSFGRPNGEKTTGTVIKVNPKTLKIRQDEERGSVRTRPAGTVWMVGPGLVTLIGGSSSAPAVATRAAPRRPDADIIRDVAGVYSMLSPENLWMDGEATRTQARTRQAHFNRQLRALFAEIGRRVTEEEAYTRHNAEGRRAVKRGGRRAGPRRA